MAMLLRPHWFAPTILLSSFLIGVALAAGHHIYYASLVGKSPEGRAYNPVTVGTALVFMVRTTLVITISTAYWQVFWKALQQKLPISTIDSLAGALSAVYEILSLKTLKPSPSLVVLALLGWCIRVAVVFPAGTITVGGHYTELAYEEVFPYPDFTNVGAYTLSSATFTSIQTIPVARSAWDGPSAVLRRSVTPVFYRVLPSLPAPRTNSSFNLSFFCHMSEHGHRTSTSQSQRSYDIRV